MKRAFLVFFCFRISILAICQTTELKTNFDFEINSKGQATGWSDSGNQKYSFSLDSSTAKSGRYSAMIEAKDENPDFGYMVYTIPHNYRGRQIKLSGYIKTENVTEGTAGFWMRIDPAIAYIDMSANGAKGTSDWKKYEVTLDLNPEKTTKILIGGMLIGKGKMWMDDLTVTIDNKEIADLKPYLRKIYPAELDKEFDKESGIASITANEKQIENLKTLGLIWGFLKYYHPSIAKGKHNWDYELFRVLPQILKSENKINRDKILVEWINKLGNITETKKASTKTSDVKIKPDLNWISESGLSAELSALLIKVKNAERPKEHYYIGLHPNVGNPNFKNENPYWSMKHEDAGYRILALYRYWNIIQYYFPYKNLIEEDWKNVLTEFIPKFIDATDKTAYDLVTLELIGRIKDTHANIWGSTPALNQYHGNNFAAVKLTFVENVPIVTGFYKEKSDEETGLAIGDIITSINNQPVEEIVKSKLKYYPASNYPTQLRDIAPNLLRSNESTIQVEFSRNDKKESKVLKTYLPKDITIPSMFVSADTSFKMLSKDIAYIDNGSVKQAHLPTIWKEIEPTKGLIIDLRNYPSSFVLYDLCNYLMPDKTDFVKFSNGNIAEPGLFTFTKNQTVGKKNKDYYKGKVVILINEISQSSSEFHTMAYRVNPNAIVIGSTTAAADGNISQFFLPGGINTAISGIGVYYPDGKETQGIGIVPDIEIKPTIQSIKSGRDELLEKAIEVINGK
ncbi:S41 family peptidase [Emticicia soli]|uniref:S41 family peptidase n=2 Tax=Emticicia soli TaxID=2027878 RepID=A0ABW5J8F9_9BACT